ncbi:DNA-directed DNA polymerase alpha subunit pol12 [Rhizina undulata]
MDTSTDTENALTRRFGDLPPEIMSEFQSMLRLHNIDANELFYKWESYSMKMGDETRLTLDTVRAFKKDAQELLEKEMRGKARMQNAAGQKSVQRAPRTSAVMGGGGVLELLDGVFPTTPASKRKLDRPHETPTGKNTRLFDAGKSTPSELRTPLKSISDLSISTPFSKRTNSGDIIEILNPHLAITPAPSPSPDRIKLVANVDVKKFSYRPLHQKLSEASEYHDDRIEEFAIAIQKHHDLSSEDFGDPSLPSPREIVAVGMIASDSLDGKLNAVSVLLESSRRMGAGSRTPLLLTHLKSYSLFPGQLVAVRGVNPNGEFFTVREILEAPRLPIAATAPETLAENAQRFQDGDFTIVIASGPYTTDDNLLFESLDKLCSDAAANPPDVMILCGPFLDSEHPLVASGDFDLETVDENSGTLDDLFRERISKLIRKVGCMVIMIPSLRDAVSRHVAFPQERLQRKRLDLPPNAKLLPNPAIFSLNETVFAVSTNDILYHLSKAEINRNPKETNPFARLTRHVLSQGHFYPLFPPASKGSVSMIDYGANVDLGFERLAEFLGVTPDVVVLGSLLGGFAKTVDGIVALNPGFLSKKRGSGTYVKMGIKAPNVSEAELAAGEPVGHKTWNRARVEVVRI